MARALIAGCGYLGRALIDLLAMDGWEVEGWTLSAASARELSQNHHPARAIDISNRGDVAAHKNDFDVVVHCASTHGGGITAYRRVYLEGARNLVDQFRNAKILFTSSTSVYAQSNGESVTEESPAEPPHERGKILREAEKLILAHSGVVMRLGGIYGPGRSALLQKFLNGRVVVGPDNDRFVNQIHRDDAASAVQLLLKSATIGGEIYNVVDNEPILLSECYRWLAAKRNRPFSASEGSISSERKRGESNKRVSNAKLRGLGWAPQYPTFADGMEKSVLPSFSASTV